ncbi:MAG: 5-formyltetrahydrofolate cyclo-ligase [Actinomycetota bacterium]|jgi:5-formyltetrahydrofolate cyclo-ligase|nr:5-formyltetrahydrofolate cyclo-ligase [Actinomycetota bacterium]
MQPKAAVRAATLSRRAALSTAERAEAGEAIAAALNDVLSRATRVAAYAAMTTEPPTDVALALCRDVLLPVVLADGDLDWAAGPGGERTARGLVEPTGPRLGVTAIAGCDVVLVPALAVDAAGHRLGRGGGSYDRALRRATGLTIAVLYDGELVDALPAEPHDVPVRAVVTPASGLVLLPLPSAGVLRDDQCEVVAEASADERP